MIFVISYLATAQDLDAEAVFRRIEKTLRDARTVQVRFHAELGDKSWGMTGTLAWTRDGKASMQAKEVVESQPRDFLALACDGRTLAWTARGSDPKRGDPPGELAKLFADGLSRLGCNQTAVLWRASADASGPSMKLSRRTLSDFRILPSEEAGAVVAYSLYSPELDSKARVKLWYDPKRHVPVRRSIVFSPELKDSAELIESYTDLQVDAELPDALFTLP